MVSRRVGGLLNNNKSGDSSSSASDLSDSCIDDLVDDLIGKLSGFKSSEYRSMTIKNRKDRVKSEREAASSSSGVKHTHSFKPYAYKDDRKDHLHRSRIRSTIQHDIHHTDSNEVSQTPPVFNPITHIDNSPYPFNRVQQRVSNQVLEPPGSVSEHRSICEASSQKSPELGVDNDSENNSEDEYYLGTRVRRSSSSQGDETNLEKLLLEKKGWKIVKVKGDGACLFRSISHQIFGDEDKHDVIRKQVVDYMFKNKEHFSPYITEDFDRYTTRKREMTCHGNHVEIQAISELYNRPVEIYHDSVDPINVFHADYSKDFPLRLSYHGHVHYNSIVDPFNPSFGHGLGMPNYQPSLSEPDLVAQAVCESEVTQLEEKILRDKMVESETRELERCLEAQAVRESYYDYLHHFQLSSSHSSGGASASASCNKPKLPNRSSTSTTAVPSSQFVNVASSSTSDRPHGSSVKPLLSSQSAPSSIRKTNKPDPTESIPTELRGLHEDTILAIVMEQSRQEYLKSLYGSRGHSSEAQESDCNSSATLALGDHYPSSSACDHSVENSPERRRSEPFEK